jgi:hypothetical protein
MATLPQRFKLLATRCAAGAPSPSRSPAPAYASPGYRLRRGAAAAATATRRRGRLRRFLCRRGGGGGGGAEAAGAQGKEDDDRKPLFGGRGRTLRDLFVASPEAGRGCDEDGVGRATGSADPGGGAWVGSRRFGSGGLRSLLLRRSWRPVLVAIPEAEGGAGKVELGAIGE